jgi:glycosyltransferase involved in cell wall biosynthesis
VLSKKRLYIEGTPLIGKHISGVGKVLLETVRALDTKEYTEKYSMYIFVPFDERKKLTKYQFTYIKVKLLPWPHKFLSLFSRMRISPPLDLFLGKGVYIFENFRNWNLLFSKSITYIHDIAFALHPEFVEERNLRFLNRHIHLWMSRTNKIVTVSKSSKKEIETHFNLDNVEVIQNAEDALMTKQNKKQINKVREKYGISNRYFLYLGNIEPRKNLVNMIRGFQDFAVKNPGYKLLIVGGDGWKNDDVIKAIDDAKNKGAEVIRPNGYVPDGDIPAIVSGAEAVLQLSWHEGFGLSVLHAVACKTHVIASDIAALKEIGELTKSQFIHYVKPDDIVQISDAMTRVTKQPVLESKDIYIPRWEYSANKLDKIIEKL